MTQNLVSIVTPTLDAARFLRETIESVLAQTYAAIEYFIVDGGSSDETTEIALSYGSRLTFLREVPSSQAGAICEGFRRASGEYYGFLNADDLLAPHCIERLVKALVLAPSAPFAYSEANFIADDGRTLGEYPTAAFDAAALTRSCFICQPSTLMRASAYDAAGGINEKYDAAFDYDLWFRLSALGKPLFVPGACAMARMHRNSKSYCGRKKNLREICAVVRKHAHYLPFSWAHAYAGVLVTGKDLFFDPPGGSLRRTLLTLWLGLQHNVHRPFRFAKEYLREIRRLRRLKRAR